MTRQFLKPKRGLIVRSPATAATLPGTGAWVEMDAYWRRRLATGDVHASEPAAKKQSKAKAKAAAQPAADDTPNSTTQTEDSQ